MAAERSTDETRTGRWSQAVVGPLSDDFLRISTCRDFQEASDRQAAMALYQQQTQPAYMSPNIAGRLSITIAQAKLVKNYGMTRMDPYVRIRVGHFVFETQTDQNGSKNPRWNRVVYSQLPVGVNFIAIEIYDECHFSMDELIAWTEIKIPDAVFRGETHEEWYPLSGKQGDGLEGMIDIVLSFATPSSAAYMYQSVAPVVMVPNVSTGRPMPVFVAPQQPRVVAVPVVQQLQQPPPIVINEEDIKLATEMFPNIDAEVIRSVFDANNGNKNEAINSLIQMTEK